MKDQLQKKLRILLADPDRHIARVIAMSLNELGLENVQIVRNGQEAIDYMASHEVHLLITEWNMQPVDGVDLVTYVRRHRNSPNRALSIIMLTGKGERPDVEAARDAGITEFVVKPFTTRTLYDRIEQLVDNPRAFVLSGEYIGPDRRRRREEPDDAERRTVEPRSTRTHRSMTGELDHQEIEPTLVMPDHVLKRVMGLPAPLGTVITPSMLESAQKIIDSMKDESLQWLREDLLSLEDSLRQILEEPKPVLADEMRAAALSIKSRAGTFGHGLASKIARLLYLFLTTHYDAWRSVHNQIVGKHIEALKVAVAHNDAGQAAIGQELLSELEKLVQRQTA